ncbi:LysM peptidoglycan-binding domain-containing protein [Bacillus badius]|uniref:LysM peptidoglycan-binding domain-containing protein n=2 Tax=Bacillus badius TaxID=1455 RepID=UPI001CC166EC|nr:LysM peptidoglycan-binding domain-containing protein [Bacillus badius]UAT31256.1 LysM peptidoglycan-binding domain-containing protein [Bacillus badius]
MEHERMGTRQERIAKLKKARAYERNSKWIGATLAVSLTAASMFVQPEEAKACDCAAPYTVKKGDTIYSLAKRFQVSVEQLKSKNGFSSDALFVGQQIIVPALDEHGKPLHLTVTEENEDLSEDVNTSKKTEQSVKLEGTETSSTSSQATVKQPTEEAAVTVAAGKQNKPVEQVLLQQTKKNGSATHIVQTGDNLWKIANKYGTTIEKIRQDNQLKTDALTIGQKLIIAPKGSEIKPGTGQKPSEPSKPPVQSGSKVTHIVQSGDSLWKIANKYGTTIEKIRQDNQLKTDALTIGQKLIIAPKGSEIKPGTGQKPPEPSKPPVQSGSKVTHIVQSGDSLWKIANKYGTTIEKIRQENQLKTDALTIGQKLIITPKGSAIKPGTGQKPPEPSKPPVPSGSKVTHIVQSGDSLWKIANKYGTTIEKIRQENQLKTDALTIGQKLIITPKGSAIKPGTGQKPPEPSKPPVPSGSKVTHIVQSGDSLWKIANKYGTTIEKIRQENQLKTDALTIGQKLIIYTDKKQTNKKEPGKIPGQKISKKPKMASSTTIIVNNDDSLSILTKKSTISLEKLAEGSQSAVLKPSVTYQIKAGDTLYSLAERFNTNVQALMKANELKYPIAIIGTDLQIPVGHVKTSQGMIIGAIDNTSIEVLVDGTHHVLEVSYGSSRLYQQQENQQVLLTYTMGNEDHRPALINVEKI